MNNILKREILNVDTNNPANNIQYTSVSVFIYLYLYIIKKIEKESCGLIKKKVN